MNQADTSLSSLRIQPLEVAIIVLAGAAGFLHLSFALLGPRPTDFPFPGLYILNAAGYLVLIMLLYLPVLHPFQRIIRWMLILFTLATILGWLAIGARDILAYLTLGIEVPLIALLLLEEWQAIRLRIPLLPRRLGHFRGIGRAR